MALKNKIVDVSQWQGVIDWSKVADCVDGAIIRCGYGSDIKSQDDRYFEYNYAQCKKYKIPVGCYLYSYANTTNEAKSELSHVRRLVKGKTFELGFWLDCEENGTGSFAHNTCSIVLDALKQDGMLVGVYANTSWWHLYLAEVTKYPRWVAQYFNQCTCKYPKVMWQYTSGGYISGINGRCDVSVISDRAWFENVLNLKSATSTSTSTTTSTTKLIGATSKTTFTVSRSKTPNKSSLKYNKKVKTICVANVRSWAGKEYTKLGTLKLGSTMYVRDAILSSNGDKWYYVNISGKYYFIHSSLVKPV